MCYLHSDSFGIRFSAIATNLVRDLLSKYFLYQAPSSQKYSAFMHELLLNVEEDR